MDKIVIEGGAELNGVVEVSGAKNAALPILAATLLAEGESVIEGVPNLRDIDSFGAILAYLGAEVVRDDDGAIHVRVTDESRIEAPYELVSTMRGSFCVLGPLLARRGTARVSLPGGCVFGLRPIDLHVKGLSRLGASFSLDHGYVCAEATKLRGAEIYLGGPSGSSVLGSANVMMAAVLAEGETILENVALEPEIQDLAHFLVAMGAKIEGIGSPRLRIEGVERLHGVRYRIIPDRIEAGTFLMAGALAGGEVTVRGARPEHLCAVLDKLTEVGVEISRVEEGIRVKGVGRPRPGEVTTLPYPGFPTDLQAQLTTLFCLADGISVVTERIYPDRFIHAAELNRLGSRIRKDGASVIVHGREILHGAEVMASDLRASAALILAGLAARGTTEIHRVYHLDRGYEKIETKLRSLGARVYRMEDRSVPTRESRGEEGATEDPPRRAASPEDLVPASPFLDRGRPSC